MASKRKTVRLMGTVIDLVIEHDHAETMLDEVAKRLARYEKRFSANDPTSELMSVNQCAGRHPVAVHPQLYHLIKIGKQNSCAPESHLNIAIGPLVQTWRIGFPDAKVPSQQEITHLLSITDPEKIHLDDEKQTVFLQQKGMAIDLGALAKGYIADLIIAYLKSLGVRRALINLGGNIVGLGSPVWKIGIQNPTLARNHHLAVLKVSNQSVVTSGIYERKLEHKGKHYHHILNPQTGYPVTTDITSLTILSKKSVDGEIWTTRLYGKPVADILSCLNQLEGIEGMVVTQNETIHYSNGFKKALI